MNSRVITVSCIVLAVLFFPARLPSGEPGSSGATAVTGSAGTAAGTSTSTATATSTSTAAAAESPFTVGEKISYIVTLVGVPAGRAVMETVSLVEINGRKAYRMKVTARSFDALDKLYPVKNDIETIIDAETYIPYMFRKSLRQGKKRRREYIKFDYKKGTAAYFKKKEKDKSFKKRTEVKIEKGTHDPLSCFCFFRTMKLEVGKTQQISVFTGKKTWVVDVEVLKKEKKRVRGVGEWTCYHIVPKLEFEGIFIHKGRVDLWVEEETRIPIIMQFTLPIGYIEVHLEKVEYLEDEKDEPKTGGEKEKSKEGDKNDD
jgi:nicotinamide mononucleotide adenylyltransferase